MNYSALILIAVLMFVGMLTSCQSTQHDSSGPLLNDAVRWQMQHDKSK